MASRGSHTQALPTGHNMFTEEEDLDMGLIDGFG
jgi:hypothetical protein